MLLFFLFIIIVLLYFTFLDTFFNLDQTVSQRYSKNPGCTPSRLMVLKFVELARAHEQRFLYVSDTPIITKWHMLAIQYERYMHINEFQRSLRQGPCCSFLMTPDCCNSTRREKLTMFKRQAAISLRIWDTDFQGYQP